MTRFAGKIGYSDTIQIRPGVWVDHITEREYRGDVLQDSRSLDGAADKLNDDLSINNSFSVVADPYAYQNFHAIRYIWWMGQRWKVRTVEVQRPRLLLTIGGVYNGPTA